jgi:hypothetical protein
VRSLNVSEPHTWSDNKHTEPFLKKSSTVLLAQSTDSGKAEGIHTAVESYVRIQLKKGASLSPEDIIESLKSDRPQLYKYFKPTID